MGRARVTGLFREAGEEHRGLDEGKEQSRNKASHPCNRSLDMATLECIFTLHNVLSDHSRPANVIGDLHTCKMRTNLSTFQWKNLTVTFCQDLSYRAKLDTKWLVILKGIVW